MTKLPQPSVAEISRLSGRYPILVRSAFVALAGLGVVGSLTHSSRIAPSGATPAAPQAAAELRQSLPALDYESINILRSALIAQSVQPPDASEPTKSAAAVTGSNATPDIASAEAVDPFTQQAMVEPPPATEPEPASPSVTDLQTGDRLVQTVPLPVPRPPELRGPNPLQYSRRASRRVAAVAPTSQAPQEDTRSFFDKVFGITPEPQSPALAYAALNQPPVASAIPRQVAPTPPPSGGGVAVYDISARIVTLPSGEKLEAHSGLGEHMDNPSSVAIKMRGATPPGVYDLTEREQLFHGVRAIRLNPVGGAGAIYGRAGLLAHTFMLGPSGASNGCISFRDYNRFLQAYLSGQVARVVVVPGNGQDRMPAVASRGTVRTAKAGD
ncbi:DUF2778 domain-containing protein [Methylobacterium brachythecii]|uniref:Tlde1 domain-containing protein n=1 Tax=Methylobacterium brachythecii TaxID=1176177 RepID=A0A7W6APZ5_9HYPH|nr:DUF2778 domain-containing protein [Methylobacterium brachythecii]MBB3904591.1 hypothetical protein [Methylobacterium brachythecii]GLS45064.1 hypothetical protein GCM10007884_30530 [Methylobacterium brachythecii]